MKIVQFTTDNREQQNNYDNPDPYFGTAPEALLEGFATIPEVEVHVVSCVRREVSIPAPLHGRIAYHPVMVPKAGWMSSLYLGCIRATSSLVRELSADIVHGQGTERDCAMNAVYSGKPNVVTIHGNMAELYRLGQTFQGARLYGKLASRLETHALGRTHGVFCNSAYTEGLVAPRARKTWRVPNAIRSAFFRDRVAKPTQSIPQIVNIGLISPRKRQLELLRAAARLHSQGVSFRIVFVGILSTADAYGQSFRDEVKRAEREGYAVHAGFLDVDDLITLMDQSHAMIHCPTEEAFGLVVAEAMARGLKFFGSNVGGVRDVSAGIGSANLYDDLGDLMTGVKEWIHQGAPMPESLQSVISRLYHPKQVAARHVAIYREVLEHST